MEIQITTLRETNPVLKTTLKTLTTKLNSLKSAPTTSELSSIVCQLQATLKEKREKLESFKSGSVKMVTKDELEKTEKEWKYWGQRRMVRKRAFKDLEGDVLEGMEGLTREDLWDKAGLEEDIM
jgi:26S proteasome regulatory subunit (ATPase 3-interacting protein)